MHITPNKILEIPPSSVLFRGQIQVELIEIPPHSRTIKILDTYKYCHLPYTQFYISNKYVTTLHYSTGEKILHYHPIVFVTASEKSLLNPKHIFSNCDFLIPGNVCWGKGWAVNTPVHPNEIMNQFWNSSFYQEPIPYQLSEDFPIFKILE